MSLLHQQFNATITEPKEVIFVQGEISRRTEELSVLEARLLAEGEKLKSYEMTVNALIVEIDYAKRRLASHERYLADLLDLKKHLDQGGPLDETGSVSDDILRHQDAIATLSPKIKQMIQELQAQRIVQKTSRIYFEVLESTMKPLLDLLRGLKLAFNPVHVVPAEIWANIFRFRLEEDVRCYLKASGRSNIRRTPLELAQVCSFWREVVHMEKDLWRYFIYSFHRISDPAQAEIWKHFGANNSGSPIILTRFEPASLATNTGPPVLVPSPASAHVLIRGCNFRLPTTLPFNQAKSITIEMDFPPTLQFMNGVGPAFPSATSITIICSTHLPQPITALFFQRTTSLKMDLTTFDSFGIEFYGGTSSTEELHILHNGLNHLIRNSGFQYPKVRVLGITPPDNVWIETIRFPLPANWCYMDLKFKPSELGLLNWPMYTPPDAPSWSIIPLILAIADQLRLVETIRCADSFIEGECLVTLVKRLTETTPNRSPPRLKVIMVCCSGITRRDCELIAASVEKLTVYV